MPHSSCFPRFALLAAFVFLLGPGFLQSQYTTATLSGIVTDPAGLTVPGAKVVVENTSIGLARTFTTRENGIFL